MEKREQEERAPEFIRPEPSTKNYRKLMEDTVEHWRRQPENTGKKPRLLLQSCCAPCSSAALDQLSRDFSLTLFFYNPNISSLDEFFKRALELKRLIQSMGLDRERTAEDGTVLSPVSVLVPDYDHAEFLAIAKGHEKDPECGERCHRCYRQRLKKTAEYMAEHGGFDFFSTTLTLSPMKSAEVLNRIGAEEAEAAGSTYLPTDFKKKGGYQRSIELSREYALYRQDYCGCEFSRAQALKRKAAEAKLG